MLSFLVQLLLIWILVVIVHVTAMAFAFQAFGVTIREVAFGFGPVVYRHGKVLIKLVPSGGYVKLKDTNDGEFYGEVSSSVDDAFNHKSRWMQSMMSLSGPAALVIVASVTNATPGLTGVVSGFSQIVCGALEPLSTAQMYLESAKDVLNQSGFFALLGLLAAKVAAFNLLPLTYTNGGQAILPWVRRDRRHPEEWEMPLANFSIWIAIAIALSWFVALIYFVAH